MSTSPTLKLGLRENLAQFSLLVLINAFVGAMVGMERSVLPALAEQEFHLAAKSALLSFVFVFGVTKALTNYVAGRSSERFGRKPVLTLGWLIAAPVPWLLMWAPSWGWVLAANALLGVSQGLTWSMTVVMKIDLAGPARRGLAMGINECAGYAAVALSALATGLIASQTGLRPEPFYLGVAFVVLGGGLSVLAARETLPYAHLEQAQRAEHTPQEGAEPVTPLTQGEIFKKVSLTEPSLSSVSQAGLINNLNDGVAWGLFPLLFAAQGLSLSEVATLAALYPGVWGAGQLFTGAWSDRVGRKPLIMWGMWTQALGVIFTAFSVSFWGFAWGAIALGAGTAMVYPTLLAAIGDVASPSWRASAVGVYRLWRDLGYAFGALGAGLVADLFGLKVAVLCVGALTFASGLIVALRMRHTPLTSHP